MDNIMDCFWVIMAIYTVRGFAVFANFWIVFDKFYDFPKREWKWHNWIWVIFYVISSFSFRFVMNYGTRIAIAVLGGIFFVRIVPFLWDRYGWKPRFLAIVLFYEGIVDCISQTIRLCFVRKMNLSGYLNIENDISSAIAEMLVLSFLLLLILLKKINLIRICFTALTLVEYIVLFLLCAFFNALQSEVFNESNDTEFMKKICMYIFMLLMILVMHTIMVRDQNNSMNNMIGNLNKPMKQITDSYIEMNEKNTELRRFRHDTKNLLLALSLLISDKKYEQASEYIDKMQGSLETIKEKAFDTGNFIADALLETKYKAAIQDNIVMTVEGNIPADRIEDVNLVILISNLVDNAIEAAKRVEGERKVEIHSILKKNIWILSVKNPCVRDVVIRENRIETTKEGKESHGFGLSNIERVAKKYGGSLKLSCENRVFTARATLMFMA